MKREDGSCPQCYPINEAADALKAHDSKAIVQKRPLTDEEREYFHREHEEARAERREWADYHANKGDYR